MRSLITLTAVLVCAPVAGADALQLSIGVRETEAGGGATGGPVFSNGGATGGIEWVNRDGQSLTVGAGWQLFTFTPSLDTLTAFAGSTANSVLEGQWGVLEHIRILNADGMTQPIRLWIDDVTNTSTLGVTVEGFEGYAVGAEVMFQEPGFSGSTMSNLESGSTARVDDAVAFAGSQSYETTFQFVDATPVRWVRLTTFDADNVLNPAVLLQTAGLPTNPTISFYARAEIIPEPASLAFGALALVPLLRRRR